MGRQQTDTGVTSVFAWREQPSEIGGANALARRATPQALRRAAQAKRYSPPIEGRGAGERSTHKRAALVRGGI